MKKNHTLRRLLAMVLSIAMVLGLGATTVLAQEADDEIPVSFTELEGIQSNLTGGTAIDTDSSQPAYADTDVVRVTIVMDQPAAMDTTELALPQAIQTAQLSQYRAQLKVQQASVAAQISRDVLNGEKLDVVWNLTLVSNAMSANVCYGDLTEIAKIQGVSAVYIETRHEPLQADVSNIIAQVTTGAASVQEELGYTGAGTRIAIIDTGTDTDHQSFDEGAYLYALAQLAAAKGMTAEAYMESLNLLTVEEIAAVLPELHVSQRDASVTAQALYGSAKLPFNFNYIDENLDVTHDNDTMGEHGSHVAGIASANSFIPTDGADYYDFDGDGDFDQDDAQALLDHVVANKTIYNVALADVSGDGSITAYDAHVLLDYLAAMDENGQFYADAAAMVGVSGTAPEAQLLTMKVFGAKGGAYSSDYMAAVEDALTLGCDAVNLSLGEASPGYTSAHGVSQDNAYIDSVMEKLEDTGVVVAIAAGNSGSWSMMDNAYGLMYTDEGGAATTTSPSTYTNAFSVASADNVGLVASSKSLFHSGKGELIPSIVAIGDGMTNPWTSLDENGTSKTYEVVFLGDPTGLLTGAEQTDHSIYGASFEGLDLTGKVVLVARGDGVYFSVKHQGAADAGAAAVLIYNNEPGDLNASIEGSTATVPCGTISLETAQKLFNLCDNSNGVFTCELTITSGKTVIDWGTEPTMSYFSSWGSTGALTIKPEITAPGGNIYSVNGLDQSGTAYEVMSGTSMATPHVSGLVALANQYLKDTDLLKTAQAVSGLELTQRHLIQSLLMSTAEPVLAANGKEAPVRQQGAGLANISNVVAAETFIMVDGQDDGKVKAELGYGADGWRFHFYVYNLTDEAQTYDMDAAILTTDTVTQDGYALSAEELVDLGAEVTFSCDAHDGKLVVPAKGQAHVTVAIDIPAEAAARMEALGYTNGFYVEGFVYLNGNDCVSHSIPLLGWYGDWSAPSMYDSGSYTDALFGAEERPAHIPSDARNFAGWTVPGSDSGYYYTGNVYATSYDGDSRYLAERNAINTMGTGSWEFFGIFPTLIRNAADLQLQVVDADTGKVYFTDDFETYDEALYSCFYHSSAGEWYDMTSEYGITCEWDYTDPETGLPVPEGTRLSFRLQMAPEYFVEADGTVDYSALDAEGTTLSYDFTVDNTAPSILGGDLGLTLSADGNTLYFTARDNNYIAAVALLDGAAFTAVAYAYPDMDADNRGGSATGSFDLAAFRAEHGNKAVLVLCDYAGNETYYALNLGGEGNAYGDLVAFQYDIDYGVNRWVSFSEGVDENETDLFMSDMSFVCAEYVNGYVFAQADNGALYGFRYTDMLNNTIDLASTYIATLDNVYQDLAYSYGEGLLYGLYTYENTWGGSAWPTAEVYSINLNGSYYDEDAWQQYEPYQEDWVANVGGVYGLGLACDDAANIYILGPATQEEYNEETGESTYTDTTAQLWVSALEEDSWSGAYHGPFKLVGETGLTMDFLQSITWDHNTETLYWARFAPTGLFETASDLLKVDPATAQCTVVGDLTTETFAMFAPLTAETAAKPEHANVPEMDANVVGTPVLRAENVTMNIGGTYQLLYDLDPWYTDHKSVIWSSDNEAVVTVDANGLVTAVGEGSATITIANQDDQSCLDTCQVNVSALSLELEGIITAQSAGVGNALGVSTYAFTMEKGQPTFGTRNTITASEDLNFGLSLATSAYGRGSIWACEYGNTGMIYEIDPATGVVKDAIMPIDGDMLFGLTYSESQDTFAAIMNMYLYVDLGLTHEQEDDIVNSYDEELNEFMFHKIDMLPYLIESNTGFVTGEDGNGASSEIVFTGITTLPGGYYYEDTYRDYMGNWAMGGQVNYQATQTLVIMDNVGRLWYIDEIVGLTKETDDWGTVMYMSEDGMTNIMHFGEHRNGMFEMEIVDEEGNVSYNLFNIRKIEESPMTDMFRDGTLPRMTYHFSDIEYAGDTEDGAPIFAISLYDYWNNGTTNELYLYVPELTTFDWDMYEDVVVSPERFFSLGNTGENNIIATIHTAKVTGGLGDAQAPAANPLAAGVYTELK